MQKLRGKAGTNWRCKTGWQARDRVSQGQMGWASLIGRVIEVLLPWIADCEAAIERGKMGVDPTILRRRRIRVAFPAHERTRPEHAPSAPVGCGRLQGAARGRRRRQARRPMRQKLAVEVPALAPCQGPTLLKATNKWLVARVQVIVPAQCHPPHPAPCHQILSVVSSVSQDAMVCSLMIS